MGRFFCILFKIYDPNNDKEIASKEALDYFGPVDWYNGGMGTYYITFVVFVILA